MSSTPKPARPAKPTTARKKPRQRTHRQWTSRQKVEAVLALWTERRKPSELCRELEIQWGTLDHWQSRALEAMLQVLEPRQRKEEERPPALSRRLQQLLEKKARKPSDTTLSSRLEKRLDSIEQSMNPSRP